MATQFDRLLAKSWPVHSALLPESCLLPRHLADVYQAADQVLCATANDQLEALGLDVDQHRDRFERLVRLAAAIHDLGKANDHFQRILRNDSTPQGLRHEWVTVLLLRLEKIRTWLCSQFGEDDLRIVEWAVAGHHPAYHRDSPPTEARDGTGTELTVLCDHQDFHQCLHQLQEWFHLSGSIPSFSESIHYELRGSGNIFTANIGEWKREARYFLASLGNNSPDLRFIAAVKNALIAGDIAGSALPRNVDSTNWPKWFHRTFDSKPKPGDLEEVVKRRLNGKPLRAFQEDVANSPAPVTLVRAGCGTGKTLAAYLWAARQHPGRRLYFCYPTTGTATEGFKDYLFESNSELGELGARLFHSRAEVDFEIILTTGTDQDDVEEDQQLEIEEEIQIDGLEAWGTPIASCTVDTVLGVIQNHKRGRYSWPALAQAAFIFDEIHAYDTKLFGALLRFLKDLPGVPVLLMTASLPDAMQQALHQTLERRGLNLPVIEGPGELEARPRYCRHSSDRVDEIVCQELEKDGKILWVCNTVGRVMEVADRLRQLHPLIYHSRFKYEDRVQRHKDVIDAFNSEGPTLAICSQVAEMSLDLSATLLVTDLAPVPALIQRLGRLNRRAEEGDPTKPFLVVKPKNALPYDQTDLEIARNWLDHLQANQISQRDLAQAWEREQTNPSELKFDQQSAWLDGGYRSPVRELRKGSPGITVLMAEDIPRLRGTRTPVARLALPMPPTRLAWRTWKRFKGLPIAPLGVIVYDKTRGAKWNNA